MRHLASVLLQVGSITLLILHLEPCSAGTSLISGIWTEEGCIVPGEQDNRGRKLWGIATIWLFEDPADPCQSPCGCPPEGLNPPLVIKSKNGTKVTPIGGNGTDNSPFAGLTGLINGTFALPVAANVPNDYGGYVSVVGHLLRPPFNQTVPEGFPKYPYDTTPSGDFHLFGPPYGTSPFVPVPGFPGGGFFVPSASLATFPSGGIGGSYASGGLASPIGPVSFGPGGFGGPFGPAYFGINGFGGPFGPGGGVAGPFPPAGVGGPLLPGGVAEPIRPSVGGVIPGGVEGYGPGGIGGYGTGVTGPPFAGGHTDGQFVPGDPYEISLLTYWAKQKARIGPGLPGEIGIPLLSDGFGGPFGPDKSGVPGVPPGSLVPISLPSIISGTILNPIREAVPIDFGEIPSHTGYPSGGLIPGLSAASSTISEEEREKEKLGVNYDREKGKKKTTTTTQATAAVAAGTPVGIQPHVSAITGSTTVSEEERDKESMNMNMDREKNKKKTVTTQGGTVAAGMPLIYSPPVVAANTGSITVAEEEHEKDKLNLNYDRDKNKKKTVTTSAGTAAIAGPVLVGPGVVATAGSTTVTEEEKEKENFGLNYDKDKSKKKTVSTTGGTAAAGGQIIIAPGVAATAGSTSITEEESERDKLNMNYDKESDKKKTTTTTGGTVIAAPTPCICGPGQEPVSHTAGTTTTTEEENEKENMKLNYDHEKNKKKNVTTTHGQIGMVGGVGPFDATFGVAPPPFSSAPPFAGPPMPFLPPSGFPTTSVAPQQPVFGPPVAPVAYETFGPVPPPLPLLGSVSPPMTGAPIGPHSPLPSQFAPPHSIGDLPGPLQFAPPPPQSAKVFGPPPPGGVILGPGPSQAPAEIPQQTGSSPYPAASFPRVHSLVPVVGSFLKPLLDTVPIDLGDNAINTPSLHVQQPLFPPAQLQDSVSPPAQSLLSPHPDAPMSALHPSGPSSPSFEVLPMPQPAKVAVPLHPPAVPPFTHAQSVAPHPPKVVPPIHPNIPQPPGISASSFDHHLPNTAVIPILSIVPVNFGEDQINPAAGSSHLLPHEQLPSPSPPVRPVTQPLFERPLQPNPLQLSPTMPHTSSFPPPPPPSGPTILKPIFERVPHNFADAKQKPAFGQLPLVTPPQPQDSLLKPAFEVMPPVVPEAHPPISSPVVKPMSSLFSNLPFLKPFFENVPVDTGDGPLEHFPRPASPGTLPADVFPHGEIPQPHPPISPGGILPAPLPPDLVPGTFPMREPSSTQDPGLVVPKGNKNVLVNKFGGGVVLPTKMQARKVPRCDKGRDMKAVGETLSNENRLEETTQPEEIVEEEALKVERSLKEEPVITVVAENVEISPDTSVVSSSDSIQPLRQEAPVTSTTTEAAVTSPASVKVDLVPPSTEITPVHSIVGSPADIPLPEISKVAAAPVVGVPATTGQITEIAAQGIASSSAEVGLPEVVPPTEVKATPQKIELEPEKVFSTQPLTPAVSDVAPSLLPQVATSSTERSVVPSLIVSTSSELPPDLTLTSSTTTTALPIAETTPSIIFTPAAELSSVAAALQAVPSPINPLPVLSPKPGPVKIIRFKGTILPYGNPPCRKCSFRTPL